MPTIISDILTFFHWSVHFQLTKKVWKKKKQDWTRNFFFFMVYKSSWRLNTSKLNCKKKKKATGKLEEKKTIPNNKSFGSQCASNHTWVAHGGNLWYKKQKTSFMLHWDRNSRSYPRVAKLLGNQNCLDYCGFIEHTRIRPFPEHYRWYSCKLGICSFFFIIYNL